MIKKWPLRLRVSSVGHSAFTAGVAILFVLFEAHFSAGQTVEDQWALDIRDAPFSFRESLMAVGYSKSSHLGIMDLSCRSLSFSDSPIAQLKIRDNGVWEEPVCVATPSQASFLFRDNRVLEAAFQDRDTLRFKGGVATASLLFPRKHNKLTDRKETSVSFQRASKGIKSDIRIICLEGEIQWSESNDNYVVEFVPDKKGVLEFALEWNTPSVDGRDYTRSYEHIALAAKEAFDAFLQKIPLLPERYEAARQLAAYIMWSCYVKEGDNFKRPGMLMSKNWMHFVWSWDHCFNAMALGYHLPDEAWDQFMVIFDAQNDDGRLPDLVARNSSGWQYVKPPVHGWTFRKLMEQGVIDAARLREGYRVLSKWTRFWMDEYDYNGDGLPECGHGCDSGWDNGSEFDVIKQKGLSADEVRVDSANLYAYLIIQMDVLRDIAVKLGKVGEAKNWQQEADALLEKMLKRCWNGSTFVSKRMNTEESTASNQSLMQYLPLLLGERLPKSIRETLLTKLKKSEHLTSFGPATEEPSSPCYVEDGYWRGPIWAPSTLIIVEGLEACGEHDLAAETARRFCDLCAMSGMAENFDPLTGKPLRDKAYTWTASTFLVLARDYVKNGGDGK